MVVRYSFLFWSVKGKGHKRDVRGNVFWMRLDCQLWVPYFNEKKSSHSTSLPISERDTILMSRQNSRPTENWKTQGKVLGYDMATWVGGHIFYRTNGYIALMLLKIQTISTYANIICCWGRDSMEPTFHETQSFTLTPARPSLVPRSNFLTHYTQGWAYFRICFV